MMRAFANTSIDDTLGASLAWNRPLYNEDRRMKEHVRSAKAFIASKKKVEQKDSTKKEDIDEMDELRATLIGQVMNATLKPLLAMQTAISEARTEDGKREFNATPPANKWAHAESIEKALGEFGLGPDHGLQRSTMFTTCAAVLV